MLEPTDACNASCIMCDQSRTRKVHGFSKGFMNLSLFKKIIADIKKFPVAIDAIDPVWSGESCTHPQFKNMLKLLFRENEKYKFFKGMVFNTNAILFDKEYARIFTDYASWLEENNLCKKENFFLHVAFSLDAVSRKTFSRIKGVSPRMYDKAINNIKYLLNIRDSKKLLLPHLIFIFIVMEENIKEFKKFKDYWSNILQKFNHRVEITNYYPNIINKDSIYFRRLISTNTKKSKWFFNKVSESLNLNISGIDNKNCDPSVRRPCGALWKTPNICHNGMVVPCCRDIKLVNNLGNIKEKSLKELWFGKKITKLRIAHITGELDDYKICKNCKEQESYISDEEILSYLDDIKREDLKEVYLNRTLNGSKNLNKVNVSFKEKKLKLNICLVSREYPPETGWGGIGEYTYQLATGLVNRGHKVHVISQSLERDKEFIKDDIFIHRISHPHFFVNRYYFEEFARRMEYSWKVFQRIKEINNKNNLDIVEGPNYSAECLIYSFFKSVPLVTRVHTPYKEVVKNFGWKMTLDRKFSCKLEKILLHKSDTVVCSTQIYKNKIINEYGLCPEKVKSIPLSIKNFQYKNSGRKEENNNFIEILFVGRLEKRKGIHVLFQAIPKVVNEVSNIQFNIIGKDTFFQRDEIDSNPAEHKSFKEIFYYDLPPAIREKINILGFIERSKLEKYYQDCDIFVAPSLHETFGLVYLEAMRYGKPVIGCKVGGVPEVIEDGKGGYVIPPEDVETLSDSIIKLSKNKELREKMGVLAKKRVEKKFNVKRMVNQTLTNYRNICKQK